jgi:hypothetical protein
VIAVCREVAGLFSQSTTVPSEGILESFGDNPMLSLMEKYSNILADEAAAVKTSLTSAPVVVPVPATGVQKIPAPTIAKKHPQAAASGMRGVLEGEYTDESNSTDSSDGDEYDEYAYDGISDSSSEEFDLEDMELRRRMQAL